MSQAGQRAERLPRSEETWQIARLRLPLWIDQDDDSPPFRPWCVVGLRLPSNFFVREQTFVDEAPPAEQVAEALEDAATQMRVLPLRLQVAEAGLADDLRPLLSRHGIQVEPAESLPELNEAVDSRVQSFFLNDPGLLAGDGVTLEQVASFAEAAASFARAEPWRHLEEWDRIEIESPGTGPAPSAIVLGSTDEERGILFLSETPDARSEGPWLVVYAPPWEVSTQDLYTWERHGLALAGEDLHPLVSSPAGSGLRPDAGLLDRLEAFLRAIAVSTEDEMDSGRWEKTVETARGPVHMVLSLPDLLHPPVPDWSDDFEDLPDEEWLDERLPDEDEKELARAGEPGDEAAPAIPDSPESAAWKLVEQAWKTVGRRRVALARQALAIWPDCVDALILLAGREPDPERSLAMYSRAVEVAERALDPLLLETHAGGVWAFHEARPYLRARFGLVQALLAVDRCDEAVFHLEELLRLDSADHVGARRRLVDILLLLERDREAARLLDACPDEILAHSVYSRTLLAFRREGDSPGARNCLTLALSRNRFVPEYLLTDEMPPIPTMPLCRPGGRSEAFLYGISSSAVWDSTPGALDWLRERLSRRRKPGRRSGKPGNRKKKKGRR